MSERVDHSAAWVLHARPYRETSLLVDVFSREHGRLALVARGARRPLSALRTRLLAFQALSLSWFGKGAVRTLHAAEWRGGHLNLPGSTLICGFYLNELLLNLLPVEDAHPYLFDTYSATLNDLAQGMQAERCLRRFELALLAELGYAEALHQTAAGEAIAADARYLWQPEVGLVPSGQAGEGFLGAMLQTLAQCGTEILGSAAEVDTEEASAAASTVAKAADPWNDRAFLQASKLLMRAMIGHHLGARALNSRQLLQDFSRLDATWL